MSKIQGEGDYKSARTFQAPPRRFAEKGPAREKPREAGSAHSSPGAREPETAPQRAERVDPQVSRQEHVGRRERALDESLDQTFPASDPVDLTRRHS